MPNCSGQISPIIDSLALTRTASSIGSCDYLNGIIERFGSGPITVRVRDSFGALCVVSTIDGVGIDAAVAPYSLAIGQTVLPRSFASQGTPPYRIAFENYLGEEIFEARNVTFASPLTSADPEDLQSLIVHANLTHPDKGCIHRSLTQTGAFNARQTFWFPVKYGAPQGSLVESDPIWVSGLATTGGSNQLPAITSVTPQLGAEVSINGGAWTAANTPIVENDVIRMRITANSANGFAYARSLEFFAGAVSVGFLASFEVWTQNAGVASTIQVATAAQLTSALASAVEGTIIELTANIAPPAGTGTEAFRARRAGSYAAPITIRSSVGNKFKIDAGQYTANAYSAALRITAPHYIVENLILSGNQEGAAKVSGTIALGVKGENVTVRNTIIRGAGTGVLTSDFGTGNFVLANNEIYDVGITGVSGQPDGHAVYIGGDRDTTVGGRVRIKDNWIYNFDGNGIKSRCNRIDIHRNEIEPKTTGSNAYYLLDLIGPEAHLMVDGDLTQVGQGKFDVFGNKFIVNRPAAQGFGIRIVSDGNYPSRGRYIFDKNTFVFSASAFSSGSNPFMRVQYQASSVAWRDNVFAIDGAAHSLLLMSDIGSGSFNQTTWTDGIVRIALNKNHFFGGVTVNPAAWGSSITNTTTGLGVLSNPALASLNITPVAGSAIIGSGGAYLDPLPDQWFVDLDRDYSKRIWATRPVSGSAIAAVASPVTNNKGAI